MKLVAHTPVGTFESKSMENTEKNLKVLTDYLESISKSNNLSYTKIDTETGVVYFKESVINSSVFEIVRE